MAATSTSSRTSATAPVASTSAAGTAALAPGASPFAQFATWGAQSSSTASSAQAGASDAAPTTPAREKEEKREADVKIILLGDSAVGKSKLIERFLMDDYIPRQLSTYALTVFRHRLKMNDKAVEVDFWDTAGQERFSSVHPSYYHRAHACVLVFDVTRKTTYTNLTQWYKELLQYRRHIPCIVVANKIDVDYSVTQRTFNWAAKRKVFKIAIEQAVRYKDNPPRDDYYEDVLRAIDYFKDKEQAEAQAAASARARLTATSSAALSTSASSSSSAAPPSSAVVPAPAALPPQQPRRQQQSAAPLHTTPASGPGR